MKLAGPPTAPVPTPEAVRRYAGDRPARAVWVNNLGGVTFAIGDPPAECVKWSAQAAPHPFAEEAERLAWASRFTRVPRVVGTGADDEGAWLVTGAIEGETAVSERWKARPRRAATAIGVGLRALHDALPVAECPYSWSVESRVMRAGLMPGVVEVAPPVDRLVVCHGDACAPNTLLNDDGTWCAHVDLGALGTADRWADLAVATMSLEWNYGPDLDQVLLDAYGIEPDPVRTDYYRRLWHLT